MKKIALPAPPQDNLPLFARLLQGPEAQLESGTAPTYHCLDQPCTKKYPSDGDDSGTPNPWGGN